VATNRVDYVHQWRLDMVTKLAHAMQVRHRRRRLTRGGAASFTPNHEWTETASPGHQDTVSIWANRTVSDAEEHQAGPVVQSYFATKV
jgi:hypothetical protein